MKRNITNKAEEKVCEKSNEIVINLTPAEREYLRVFLKDCGLRFEQRELFDTQIDIANGQVKFETTFNELSEKHYKDAPENPTEKKSRRDNLGDRLRRTLAKKWRLKNGIDFFAMNTECRHMNEITKKRNAHCVEIELFFLSKLAEIIKEGVTDIEERFTRLRQIYGISEAS